MPQVSWKKFIPQPLYNIIGKATITGRPPKYSPIPHILHVDVQNAIKKNVPNLYSHQASAIEAFLKGNDICLATSTASGKSLVFMSCATDILLRDKLAKCIVLYPAKALIMDQLERWNSWCAQFGLNVGYIHGGVDGTARTPILLSSRVILMTPDVAHAWIMSRVHDKIVRRCLEKLAMVVLDEAHVYEGVFGSNMAYFMRRLSGVSPNHRLLMTTATIGDPTEFAFALSGRSVTAFATKEDGAKTADKDIVVISDVRDDGFQSKVELLRRIRDRAGCRFLAFADSRKMVELLTVAVNGGISSEDENDKEDSTSSSDREEYTNAILPYRSGYEDHDRNMIQKALHSGSLRGVISTSALELGLDIGELNLVILLGIPPTSKSFWQRIGRVGRRTSGTCVIVDTGKVIDSVYGGIQAYLNRPIEPNWLYMDNRKIQYSNALCASVEISDTEIVIQEEGPFSTLPESFRQYLLNEMNPTKMVDSDLLLLKQRAQGSPHREFPLRSAMEISFTIRGAGHTLGSITFSQVLREAYPGGIYYYMARAYRVKTLNFKNKEIIVERSKRWTTNPIGRIMAFPDLTSGVRFLRRTDAEFVAECEMQVSEQVLGFREKRGFSETIYTYGPTSEFYHRPLQRFFQTSGVCWSFPHSGTSSPNMAQSLLVAYCTKFGIDSRDVGIGYFYAKSSPYSRDPVQGVTIYDSTDGSLRLTQKLAEHFDDVINAAIAMARGGDARILSSVSELQLLLTCSQELRDIQMDEQSRVKPEDDEWITVIAGGEDVIYTSEGACITAQVLGHLYTPQGLKYRVKFPSDRPVTVVAAHCIQPLHGATKLVRFNLNTGEMEDGGKLRTGGGRNDALVEAIMNAAAEAFDVHHQERGSSVSRFDRQENSAKQDSSFDKVVVPTSSVENTARDRPRSSDSVHAKRKRQENLRFAPKSNETRAGINSSVKIGEETAADRKRQENLKFAPGPSALRGAFHTIPKGPRLPKSQAQSAIQARNGNSGTVGRQVTGRIRNHVDKRELPKARIQHKVFREDIDKWEKLVVQRFSDMGKDIEFACPYSEFARICGEDDVRGAGIAGALVRRGVIKNCGVGSIETGEFYPNGKPLTKRVTFWMLLQRPN